MFLANRLVLILALLVAGAPCALAQTGQLAPGQVWGNPTATKGPASPSSPAAVLSRAGSLTGNTQIIPSVSGALTPGDCVRIDVSGNFVDNGAGCGANSNTPHTQDFLAGTNFTAGTTTTLTLSSAPTSTDLLIVTFDGIWQSANTWSLAGAVVTFNAAIPLNTQVVEAKWSTSSTLAGVGSIGQSGSPLTGAVTVSAGSGISIVQTLQNIAFTATSPLTGFGAKCDGVTDDTVAIQNAWNAAAALGKNLNLSGVGTSCVISSITQPTPIQRSAGLLPPIASMLTGDGPNSVQLISTVTGTACAITLSNTFNSYQTASKMGGFALKQTTGANAGEGLCINNGTKLAISNISVYGFDKGILCQDCIDIHLSDSTFTNNNVHIFGARVSNSNPNAWVINSNLLVNAVQYGIELVHPDQINILNNTFEANGTNLGLSPATILIDGLAVDGSFGGNISGNYFEFDAQEAIAILQLAGDVNSTSFNITGNGFIRNSSNETSMIFVNNAASAATNIVSINLFGNNFLDTSPYVPGTKPYISLTNPTVPSAVIMCLGNTYNTQSSMPAKCRVPGPSASFSMDANGVFGGF